jgi:putative hemolysin
VLGVVSSVDLLEQSLAGAKIDLRALARPAGFVPDSVTVMDLLEHFKRNRSELALVVDEYGEIEGLVTLNDVLEALVGDLPALDEEADQDIVQRDDGSWLIDGSIAIDQLRDAIGFTGTFPDEGGSGYHTVAGLVMTDRGEMEIKQCRLQTRMSQVLLDEPKADSRLQEMGGIRMSESVDGYGLAPPQVANDTAHGPLETGAIPRAGSGRVSRSVMVTIRLARHDASSRTTGCSVPSFLAYDAGSPPPHAEL